MKTKYKHIHFERVPSTTKKTSIWKCKNNSSLSCIGVLRWHSPWRQYCFFPIENTVFSKGCFEDINNFITQLMEERKK